MNVKRGVFPGNGRLDGHYGDLAVSVLNAGVAAVERADRLTRARSGAEAREIMMDLVSILSGWQVEEGDEAQP